MQKNITWTGQNYNSLENCQLNYSADFNYTKAVIDGFFEGKTFHTEYTITTNQYWCVTAFDITSIFDGKSLDLHLESNGKGKWINNGKHTEKFDGCIDIDISLTPFTNSLPIKRLQLRGNEKQQITVLYIDVLEQQTKRIDQIYTRLSANLYNYENASKDFQSLVIVDDDGLVVNYPNHFIRTATA